MLFDPLIGPYQVLPLQGRVDSGAMAMKGFSAFSKAPALLEPDFIFILEVFYRFCLFYIVGL